jgi:hypothetical protein
MGQRSGYRRRTPPTPSPYAGSTTCLRCDARFESWDRRQNRLCEPCHAALAVEPSEEPSYPIPKGRRRPREGGEGVD